MIVTPHAQERWNERFPGMAIDQVFLRANLRIGKKLRRELSRQCPANKIYCKPTFRGRYFKRTRDDIIFVMAPPETIITVFRLEK